MTAASRPRWICTTLFPGLALGSLLGILGCGKPVPERPSMPFNLLVLQISDLGHQDLQDFAQRSPSSALARLQAESSVYEKCLSDSDDLASATSSLWTGLRPNEHGLRLGGVHRLPSTTHGLAHDLRARGGTTAAFVSNSELLPHHGVSSDFEHVNTPIIETLRWELVGKEGAPTLLRRTSAATLSAAQQWLVRRPSPWLLWVQIELEGPDSATRIASLERSLTTLEQCLEPADRRERTIVVLTASGGDLVEGRRDPHVPLVIRIPGRAPRSIEGPCALSDVHAIVRAAMDSEPDPSVRRPVSESVRAYLERQAPLEVASFDGEGIRFELLLPPPETRVNSAPSQLLADPRSWSDRLARLASFDPASPSPWHAVEEPPVVTRDELDTWIEERRLERGLGFPQRELERWKQWRNAASTSPRRRLYATAGALQELLRDDIQAEDAEELAALNQALIDVCEQLPYHPAPYAMMHWQRYFGDQDYDQAKANLEHAIAICPWYVPAVRALVLLARQNLDFDLGQRAAARFATGPVGDTARDEFLQRAANERNPLRRSR